MKALLILTLIAFCSINSTAQHTLVLKNGDKLQGVVMSIEDDVLHMAINRQLKKFPLIEVSALFFNEHVPYDGALLSTEPTRKVKSGNFLVEYNIKDREMIEVPKVSNGTEQKGTVVVDVVVNRNGNVMRAKPGGVGSTTTSEYLYTKAQFAAQGAKFNPHPTGPLETNGQIIIHY